MPTVLAFPINSAELASLECDDISGGSISCGIVWFTDIVDSNMHDKWSMISTHLISDEMRILCVLRFIILLLNWNYSIQSLAAINVNSFCYTGERPNEVLGFVEFCRRSHHVERLCSTVSSRSGADWPVRKKLIECNYIAFIVTTHIVQVSNLSCLSVFVTKREIGKKTEEKE